MKAELTRWGIHGDDIHVVHDYAASFFRRATLEQTHELFMRLRPALSAPPGAAQGASRPTESAFRNIRRSSRAPLGPRGDLPSTPHAVQCAVACDSG
jgi:hypothetical protein